jgi:hypothetical protein
VATLVPWSEIQKGLVALKDTPHGLTRLESVCAAFEARFGEPLSLEDLRGFLEMAQARGLLQATLWRAFIFGGFTWLFGDGASTDLKVKTH